MQRLVLVAVHLARVEANHGPAVTHDLAHLVTARALVRVRARARVRLRVRVRVRVRATGRARVRVTVRVRDSIN